MVFKLAQYCLSSVSAIAALSHLNVALHQNHVTANMLFPIIVICRSVLTCCLCFCSVQLQSEVEKPLLSFRENFKKDMKRFDHHIADLRKQLVGRYAAVEKVQIHKDIRS